MPIQFGVARDQSRTRIQGAIQGALEQRCVGLCQFRGRSGCEHAGFARDAVQKLRPVQGNLDPLVLRAGGAALDRSIDAVLEAFADGPFIFNLGHGILPDTPIAHVEQMIARVRG